ncbi:MAG: phosphoribosylanthranilate isomerase [Anaerolineae bacterium]|nr:phosphoribosylanthranilate isomerase [Anaerolineae bacterium]
MTRIKLCGVTTVEDAAACVQAGRCARAGVDMLGLNFYRPSPRYISPDTARQITDTLRGTLGNACPVFVGVFVNETADAIQQIIDAAGLDAAQLSGDEPVEVLAQLQGRAFKGIRPRSVQDALQQVAIYLSYAPEDERLPSLLVDAFHKHLYGGTGEQASLDIALAVKQRVPRLMLAGGLKPENVSERVRAIQPWGVDTASGVESGQPGVKDISRVSAFIAAVRLLEK